MENQREIIESYIKFPLKEDKDGEMILDSDNAPVLQIRGWGWMQKLERPFDKALQWQAFAVRAINEYVFERGTRTETLAPRTYERAAQQKVQEATIKHFTNRTKKLEDALKRSIRALEDLGNQRTSEGRTGDLIKDFKRVLGVAGEED